MELRCTPLTNNWLVRMMALDGVRSVADLWRCHLNALVFWARVRVAHFAMMRLCEHEDGMQIKNLSRFEVGGMAPRFEALCARFGLRTEYFVLEVGSAPEGLEPRFMANRKRPARFAVLPVGSRHVSGADSASDACSSG